MFKNNKAQSALEYLMTYGWALVVIVIVIAVLVFLINPTQIGQNNCTGFDKLPIGNHQATDNNVSMIITNETGQNLTAVSFTLSGKVGTQTISDTNSYGNWSANAKHPVWLCYDGTAPNCGALASVPAPGSSYDLSITVDYTDSDGFARSATASCKGKT